MRRSFPHSILWLTLAVCFATVAASLGACDSGPRRRARQADNLVVRDVPAVFRGVIGSMASIGGIENTLVSGYGIVVGLNGTGGGALDERVAASMERLMGLRGIGRANAVEGTALEDENTGLGRSPREMLRDPSVAVVLVQAAVPPGAPEGFEFDVYLRALNATSLDGGTLWTTDLRLGPPSVFGGVQARRIATATGDVFVNPFAEPGQESAGVSGTRGRVLSGGQVVDPLEMTILLDNASLTRARQMVSALNSRFREGPGDMGPTARGRDGSTITVRIPTAWRDRPSEFVQIVRFLTIDRSFPEETARRFVRAIESQPELSADLTWCLIGLGEVSIPFLRPLYDHAELDPKLAGLRAGAILGDPRVAEPAITFAKTAPTAVLRSEACGLLGRLDGNPAIDIALQELLEEDNLQIRVAAYEALADRAERTQARRLLASADQLTLSDPSTPARIAAQAERFLPITNPQRVGRLPIGDKFLLDRVPGGDPLIYITQQGQPRIVLMGDVATVSTPALASAWSSRFMLAADTEEDGVRVYYRPGPNRDAMIQEGLDTSLAKLTQFFAHEPTPEDPRPGLGLSYSETVGALYAIHQDGATEAAFATERDRLLAALIEATAGADVADRPEFDADEPVFDLDDPSLAQPGIDEDLVPVPVDEGSPTLVVPIPPRDR